MQYATLGHSGIRVSKICLGGMSFGKASPDFHQWTIGPEDTKAVIARALDCGVNFIDTANTYAFGTSEEYIGRALRELGIQRDQVVLASKVFFNEGRLSREAINREIDGTLKRLGTDYLDLYIIHRFDYGTPIKETMEALDALVRAGKVRALGASEMYAYQLHNMQVVAEQNGWTTFTSMQCHYNLLYREDEREMIPVCRQFDMALTPHGLGAPVPPHVGLGLQALRHGRDHAQQVRRCARERHAGHRAHGGSGREARRADGAGCARMALGARR